VETRQGLGLQRFPNLPVSLEQIGTDPQRARAVTPALLHAIESSPLHRYIAAEPQDGYLAPSLSGLWATAPYLHNGSVPTLWHLLHPEARPIRFQAGGHLLDLDRVGIAGEPDGQGGWGYPIGYRPWSTASWFDTRQEGHSNLGHEYPFESLGEQDKNDLIEYLKRL
jgi:hypothetical protein